jgi:hypothetical protein
VAATAALIKLVGFFGDSPVAHFVGVYTKFTNDFDRDFSIPAVSLLSISHK